MSVFPHPPWHLSARACVSLAVVFGALVGATAVAGAEPVAQAPAGEVLFARRVWPMFEQKCLACHGRDEEKIKGGFVLRTREDMMLGGDSAKPAVVPGKPDDSPLYRAISRHDEDWKPMPPKDNDRLASEQIAYIRDWIAAGAPWPNAARITELMKQPDPWAYADGVPVPTSGGLSADWTNRKYKPENLWAFQPLRKPGLPVISSQSSVIRGKSPSNAAPTTDAPITDYVRPNPIDAFLNAKLAEAKLTPAPRADRRTLLRRAAFDLIGLPPTPEELQAFLADPAEDATAFAKVVERLLASPHYGEQWGQHWLDVTRYADSSGFANDYARGPAWRYRDYVVRAFNDDKPYDQFIREQIAGDEIAAEEDLKMGRTQERETQASSSEVSRSPDVSRSSELLVATGFLRTGPWELTGMEVAKVARQKYLDDVTDSVGQVFLAQPLQCARCHDHKFDPIPTRDYYSFQAVFATTQFADRPAPFQPTENTAGFEEKKYLLQRQTHYREILQKLDVKSFAAARAWLAEKKIDPAAFEKAAKQITASGKSNKKRGTEAGYAEVRQAMMRQGIPEEQIPPKLAGFTPEDFGIERIARKGLARIRWDLDRYEPVAFSVYDGRTPEMRTVDAPMRMPADRMESGELEQTCILTGGDPFANGAKVEPHPLSAVSNLAKMEPSRCSVPAEISGRRRALAEWIASPENPLTARVIVNRIWGWHFGQSLAGNPNNFGATGKKPTHPELLDWLAASFVQGDAASGVKPWSIKSLHRLIMMSDAYQRASETSNQSSVTSNQSDPQALNTDLLITDYCIFKPRRLTAEEIRDAMLSVSGELNPALGGIPVRPEMNREAALQPRQVMGTFAEAWQPSPKPEQRNRRTIYALKLRGQRDPMLDVFNSPSPDLSCERRDESTVTPQSLSLFNSAATMDRAVALAARVIREAPAGPEAAIRRLFELVYGRAPTTTEIASCRAHWDKMTARHRATTIASPPPPREVVREAVEENTGEKFKFVEPLEAAADFVPDLELTDVPVETRGLAELCLVLLNSNEFAFVY